MKIKINEKEGKKFKITDLATRIVSGKFYKRKSGGDIWYYFLSEESGDILEIFSPLNTSQEFDNEPSIVSRRYDWFSGYTSDIFVEEIDCQLDLTITEV